MTIDDEMKALKEREAKAAAELEPFLDQRATRRALGEYRRKVERKEQAAKDAPRIVEAEDEHGPIGERIAVVETDLGAIVVKRPHHLIFRRFQDKGSTKSDDLWALVKPSIVYPDAKRVDQIIEELPATLSQLADEVVTLAGVRSKEAAGK